MRVYRTGEEEKASLFKGNSCKFSIVGMDAV